MERESVLDTVDKLMRSVGSGPRARGEPCLARDSGQTCYAEGSDQVPHSANLLDDILRRKSLSGQTADVRLLLYPYRSIGKSIVQVASVSWTAPESVPNEDFVKRNFRFWC